MKGILLSLAGSLVFSSAWAQQTTTKASAPAAATTTTTTEQAKPTVAKKWGASFISYVSSDASEMNNKGTQSKVTTNNIVSLSYKATDEESYGIAGQFDVNYVPDLKARSQSIEQEIGAGALTRNGYKPQDPFVSYSKKYKNINMLGQKDLGTTWKLYPAIVGDNYMGANARNNRYGALRFTTSLEWQLNPKWSISYDLDPRAYFRQIESGFRLIQGPTAKYSLNDKTNTYLNVNTDTAFGRANEGGSLWTGVLSRNWITSELGVEWAANKNFVLVGSYGSTLDISGATLAPFSEENSSYNLLVVINI